MQELRSSLPDDYPITGLCIVRDIHQCPSGYKPIDKTHDRQDDADLWKDGMFGRRNTRYICVTRIFPLAQGNLNNVLVDVAITNEKDPIPPGFSHVELTQDTSEKAIKKKNFCVKLISRNATVSAITELILLSKAKRAPPGYTIVGDINNILLCYKMGRVPPETQNKPANTPLPYALHPSSPSRMAPQPPQAAYGTGAGYHINSAPQPQPTQVPQARSPLPTANYNRTNDLHQGQGDPRSNFSFSQATPAQHPLSGVPFKLNSAYQAGQGLNNLSIPDIQLKSRSQVFQEFSYQFTVERTAAQRIPPELD